MPGHGRAAIKAMEARYHRLKRHVDPSHAHTHLLSDLDDQSSYMSIQAYRDNAINPCLQVGAYSWKYRIRAESSRKHCVY